MTDQAPFPQSPFHAGEQEAQDRVGKRASMEAFGKVAIRPFMPEQHRVFFEQLPFVVLGSVDEQGWPWASILTGGKGFITSPSSKRLNLAARPAPGDPLQTSLKTGAPIGLLGIEIPTRRRNRMNAQVIEKTDGGFSLGVMQSFGNCPQYIQTRDIEFIRDPAAPAEKSAPISFTELDQAAIDFIEGSDTFFVSSYISPANGLTAEGVDVSHRGGKAGFVKVDGNTLTIPDYSGNNFFNTIGNFLVNPKAGLIFPDFETGDLLMLTGTVELLWEDHPEVIAFKGAERGWRFTLDHGLRLSDALPFRSQFGEWSPNSLMADDWATSDARAKAEEQRNTWRTLRVAKIEDESSVIRSFYLEAIDGQPLLSYEAGQFLTIRVRPDGTGSQIRTYTLSSAPADPAYRISVKREPGGIVSNHLHDNLIVGDTIEIKAPKGAFYIDALEKRPAVLLAGGVGITPMMAMTRHVLNEGVRKRYLRPLTVFHAAQTTDQRTFAQEFRAAEAESNGKIRYVSVIGHPTEAEVAGEDFDASGRIDVDTLRAYLVLDDYDFFLCGPSSFMQAMYDLLRNLGVADARIFAESFGPAVLSRRVDAQVQLPAQPPEAEMSVVKFEKSGFEQKWETGDGTLLETAEAHGLTPDFSCRAGSCGSCAVQKLSGEVAYRTPPTAKVATDDVLICCAVPAQGSSTLVLDL
ncbi:FAD-binding oxidoreductase [Parasedimentitalea maritima]|uniref:2Fe-2S iron-sulfur cluster binding domain-containing protein n=1 Tax=Parasedimentitalea maritima TaxID=2578117 RepID=A0A6A4RCX8_9RHOB|nr:pyridoxamine 5'-phosphate oxidase family protein [Zongyanglinia marina]KAE9625963.1 2Fe-2S iron-sulfur cluster binding domain-containing protein [Zongyanglinia marina]